MRIKYVVKQKTRDRLQIVYGDNQKLVLTIDEAMSLVTALRRAVGEALKMEE